MSSAASPGSVRLTSSTLTLRKLARLRQSSKRLDLTGMPLGALAFTATHFQEALGIPSVLIVPSLDEAQRLVDSLTFFSKDPVSSGSNKTSGALLFPPLDNSPYAEVAPDRRALMDRMSVLATFATEQRWSHLVVPIQAILRKVPPCEDIRDAAQVLSVADIVDRDELVGQLTLAGYLRVPLVEDPGSLAVRGHLLDLYPPGAALPVRVEFDDELVVSIREFDPDTQRVAREVERILCGPVRDVLFTEAHIERATQRIRARADEALTPSRVTRRIVDELSAKHYAIGVEQYLPAFYPHLYSLLSYCGGASVTVLDPIACHRVVSEELAKAENDYAAKVDKQRPSFPVDQHFLTESELQEQLLERDLTVIHRNVVSGSEARRGWDRLERTTGDVLELGGEDQSALASALSTERKHANSSFDPLAKRISAWRGHGLRIVLGARSQTQAERIISVLKAIKVPVSPHPTEFEADARSQGQVQVAVGSLREGFVLPAEGLTFVSEEDLLGTRGAARASKPREQKTLNSFLQDLRELQVDDYVVHAVHGIGRYVGLEQKTLPQSRLDVMNGVPPVHVEVLVVEYAGGDRLFLPITRLNQIQKFSGAELSKVRIDRLGGKSFSTKKAKVQKAVRQMADSLLKLYAERSSVSREPLEPVGEAFHAFEAAFPYEETHDQARAIDDVMADLETEKPMDRLVCGDVGFGKTEVALRAAFRVAMSGRQVAVLAPTTVLAQQHFHTFSSRLSGYPLDVRVLSRFVDRKEQTHVLQRVKDGTSDVLIGTHRILSRDVRFKNLGLLVVDEEQRFGVAHKERIKQLRAQVDVLTLSATPIPRTLQLAVGGLRNLSLITTPPVDRRATRTYVCQWDEELLAEAVRRELSRGGQLFFVHNRIEGLYEQANKLQAIVPEARLAIAHGQMKEGQLERVMTDFIEGQYEVLCCTAIIESGLDIPRANTILIDRADMFGLSQLYQLRGRVGRGGERAFCYLIAPPLSTVTDEARARIEALERFTELGSGFQVATLDMELRGAGDLLGANQSGHVASVGFDLFVSMLEEAVASLRGEVRTEAIDPEVQADVEHFLPEHYVEDVGLRLTLYKRFSEAADAAEIEDIAGEMEERFGHPPNEARQFVRVVSLKPKLRELRIVGCDATEGRTVFHLPQDTRLDPQKTLALVGSDRSRWQLTPAMKLIYRHDDESTGDAIERAHAVTDKLYALLSPPTD